MHLNKPLNSDVHTAATEEEPKKPLGQGQLRV